MIKIIGIKINSEIINYCKRNRLINFLYRKAVKFISMAFLKVRKSGVLSPEIDINQFNLKKISHDSNISVIIPTKNAGNEFHELLISLHKQIGIKKMEIIIVDSGSSDDTVKTAEKYKAKVIKIPEKEFSHSYTRNLGAENAGCDYLLFMTQDAFPTSEFWVYRLLNVIKTFNVTAVSCMEEMKSDAELFYRVINWSHMQFLKLDFGDRILFKPPVINHLTLRKNGQLSDIACLIKKSVFMKYKFRYNYAEDLDLGIRLIKDGYKLALLSSVKVIHSHNRPAFYYLKRSYVETRSLSKILPGFPVLNLDYNNLVNDICFNYFSIYDMFDNDLSQIRLPCKINYFVEFVSGKFRKISYDKNLKKSGVNNKYCDEKFSSFIQRYFADFMDPAADNNHFENLLSQPIIDFVTSILKYMKVYYENIDADLLNEFEHAVYKYFALVCGNHLAFFFIAGKTSESKSMAKIHNELSAGV